MNLQVVKKINELEHAIAELPQCDIPTREFMMGALYVREITIPQHAAITSRVYKRAYVDVMVSGDITITDSNGTYRLTGYNLLEGVAGRKRAGYAHEETKWLCVYDCQDIKNDPINDISFATLEDYGAYAEQLKLPTAPTLHSERMYSTGQVIGPATLAESMAQSQYPNAMIKDGQIICIRAIDTGQEITRPMEQLEWQEL